MFGNIFKYSFKEIICPNSFKISFMIFFKTKVDLRTWGNAMLWYYNGTYQIKVQTLRL